MILADYHNHCNFSTDSKATPESMLEQAISLGIRRYCFTDHMDLDFPLDPKEFIFDVDEYFKKLNELSEQYGHQIMVRKGIELGLRNEPEVRDSLKDRYEALVNAHPFDYVIGSVHCLEYCDPYYSDYWERHSAEEGLRLYFEVILDCCMFYDSYDVLGHLDYLRRYVPKDRSYDLMQYTDLYDAILKTIISKGKGLEVNTSYYGKGGNEPHPNRFILNRYRELGGDLITIGSDAHDPSHLGVGYEDARRLLLSLGYRYYATFEGRKPSYHDIPTHVR